MESLGYQSEIDLGKGDHNGSSSGGTSICGSDDSDSCDAQKHQLEKQSSQYQEVLSKLKSLEISRKKPFFNPPWVEDKSFRLAKKREDNVSVANVSDDEHPEVSNLPTLQLTALACNGNTLTVADCGDSKIKQLTRIAPGTSALSMRFQTRKYFKVMGKVSGILVLVANFDLFDTEGQSGAMAEKSFVIYTVGSHSLIVHDLGELDSDRIIVLPPSGSSGKHKAYLHHLHSCDPSTMRSDDKLLVAFQGSNEIFSINFHKLFANNTHGRASVEWCHNPIEFTVESVANNAVRSMLIAVGKEQSKKKYLYALPYDCSSETLGDVYKFVPQASALDSMPWNPTECCVSDNGVVFVANENCIAIFDLLKVNQSDWQLNYIRRLEQCPHVEWLTAITVSSNSSTSAEDKLELLTFGSARITTYNIITTFDSSSKLS